MASQRNNNRDDNSPRRLSVAGKLHDAELAKLVTQAADGDYESFTRLYHTYVTGIYQYVFYKVKDKMTAEDITQQVFVKAMKSIGTCKGRETTFSSWLYRIAHNQTMDTFRRAKPKLTVTIEIAQDFEDPNPSLENRMKRQELLEVIAELPESQRDIIILKFIEGLDNNEIGTIMGKSQGAIRILQMRALAALRQKLDGIDG